jgi:hypothetical protein
MSPPYHLSGTQSVFFLNHFVVFFRSWAIRGKGFDLHLSIDPSPAACKLLLQEYWMMLLLLWMLLSDLVKAHLP